MNEPVDEAVIRYLRQELADAIPSRRRSALEKVIAAAIGGIPWVGQVAAIGIAMKGEEAAQHRDALLGVWIETQAERYKWLQAELSEDIARIDKMHQATDERLESEEYLQLVRRTFRVWDRADSDTKRRYAGNVAVNAAGTRVVDDDVVRLFIDLLDQLHELHLRVIHELFDEPRITRRKLWDRIYGTSPPKENSAEADLWRVLIRELSFGGLARQHKETTAAGDFIDNRSSPRPRRPPTAGPRVVGSSFEDVEQYELTNLGRQFVHYVMTDVVGQIGPGRTV